MAQITGNEFNNILDGTDLADRIEGLGGDDYLWAHAGDDIVLGGEGNDVMHSQGGADQLDGGGGNDLISATGPTHPGQVIVATGGAGIDRINFSLWGDGGGIIQADGGDGDDTMGVQGLIASTAVLTLGAGRDSVRFHGGYQGLGQSSVVVTDFATGAAGDRIDWDVYLVMLLSGWDSSTNPFASGHMRVTQQGADVLLEIDRDGAGSGFGFASLLTFQNVALADLTAENLGGYPRDGGPAVGLTITGGPDRDELRGSIGGDLIEGLGGNDQILSGLGDDILRGGDGDDDLRGEDGDDLLEGGIGKDALWSDLGDDRLYGGDGDDHFLISGGNDTDEIYGEGGNDLINFGGGSSAPVNGSIVSGGAGDDQIHISLSSLGSSATFDAGTGADVVTLWSVYESTAWVTLGEGRDTLRLYPTFSYYGSAIIQDFTAGANGDLLDWIDFLGSELRGWDGAANPFSTGHLRLVQSGADTIIEIDEDGFDPWGNSSYETLLTLRNLNSGLLTAASLGYAPNGAAPASKTLTGTLAGESLTGGLGSDLVDGGGGDDTIAGGPGHDVLRGGEGADTIAGDLGNDRVEGGGGADILSDGLGSDRLYGGEGDDRLTTSAGPTDELHGEGGNDTLIVMHGGGGNPSATRDDQILVTGGVGNDSLVLRSDNSSFITADAGSGDDVVTLQRSFLATFTVTLGAGRDTVRIQSFYVAENVRAAIVTDFTAGRKGDTLDWDQFVASSVTGWNGTTNPFAAGYLRLLQVGADTLVQLDYDAAATRGSFQTVLTLKNVSAHFFEAANFDGFDPHSRTLVAGTAGADTLTGTAGRDAVDGGAGNDRLLLQSGGDDTAYGGDGDDIFYFGSAFTASDRVDGEAGRDSIVLQGNVNLTLSNATFTGIESISMQSGANPAFGDTANNFYDFSVTTADGNVLAGQQLIVNAQSLRAGEDFTFNGSAESNGSFLVYGGHGVDVLKGGAGADVFFFEGSRWGANDRVDGGGGRDALVISGGSGLTSITFAANAFTNIESISLNNHFASDPSQKPSYQLVLNNGNVAAGTTLIVNGSSIPAGQVVGIDGRAELDGNLILLGGGGNDTLRSGGGSDVLIGGGGADSLAGYGGADTFRYDAALDSAPGRSDLIGDFKSGLDKIDLSRVDANTTATGNQAFSWIGANAFSGVAGQLRTYDSGGYRWIAGDTDGDSDADILIAFHPTAAPQVQGDFLL